MQKMYTATCDTCTADGEWWTRSDRDGWIQDHETMTGHDSYFSRDIPVQLVRVPGQRTAQFYGRCTTCSHLISPGEQIVPRAVHWQCLPCAKKGKP